MSINPTLQNSAFLGHSDFTWWLGTVENADDRDGKLGRVRVKILGFHDPSEKPENLPWALVLQPTTNPAVSGIGNAANCLKPGSFVMGFFLDYPDCQQPVVLGTFYSQIKAIGEPGTYSEITSPGAANIIDPNISKTGQPQDSERTNDEGGVASQSVAAASLPASPSNPSGNLGANSIADGKDGPAKTLVEDIKRCVEGLGNIFKTGIVYNPNATNPTLTKDLSKEEQKIPVTNPKSFPPRGIVEINGERIGYNGINEYCLINAKRGMNGTTPKAHAKGVKVKYIPKTDSPIEVYGKFTNKIADVKGAVDMCLNVIRNLVWYIINQVKSWLMAEITKYLNMLGLSSSSPIPYFVKTLTEVVIQILKTIGCTFDEGLADALMNGIEGFIKDFVEGLTQDLIDMADNYISLAEQCVNDIFGSIFELTSVAAEIASSIEDILSVMESVGSIGNMGSLFDANGMVNANMLSNIGNIVSFILQLLGIGCDRTTESPIQIDWNECTLTGNNCNPFNFRVTNNIAGKWNPEYSKQFVQSSEAGHLIMMDDTPYNNRLVIEAANSRTGFQVDDDGNIRVTNSKNKVEVTFGEQNVTIKGNAYISVKGDYHLKVGGNYHLEVDGQYNVWANRESKVTYNGEHETLYKNDSKLSAANGLALAGSKIGLSASGSLDIISPTFSSYCTEQNHLCSGSWNLFAFYENKYIGLHKFCLVGGNKINLRAGTNSDVGTGVSNKFQASAENTWKGGLHNMTIMGTNSITKLGIMNDTTQGVASKNRLAVQLESVGGTNVCVTAAPESRNVQGPLLDISGTLCMREAPIIIDN
jgi:hypothetical protein